jgi:proteic killer suppression protein
MIRSWRNAASRRVWDGEAPNQFRGLDCAAAVDLLSALNVAKSLQDLSPLKSVGLHKLKGNRAAQMGDDGECTLAHLLFVQEGRCARCRDR